MLTSVFAPLGGAARAGIPGSFWPQPPENYDPGAAAGIYERALKQWQTAEDLGMDWISLSEHHYAGVNPTPIVTASALATATKKIKVAYLGPNMPLSNPIRVAEELSMLDNLSNGRLIVGLLRGTPNEFQVYGVNPEESRDMNTEGMELVLRSWQEGQPFGWEGRHYQYRSVAVWPRPLQQPFPPTYALGFSHATCDFAAKHRLGMGVSFNPIEELANSTDYYRAQCAKEGWTPEPKHIIHRAALILCETNEEAQEQYGKMKSFIRRPPFEMRRTVQDTVIDMNEKTLPNMAREHYYSGLDVSYVGGPDEVVQQIQHAQESSAAA